MVFDLEEGIRNPRSFSQYGGEDILLWDASNAPSSTEGWGRFTGELRYNDAWLPCFVIEII